MDKIQSPYLGRRISWIDGLKGFSAVIVVIYHTYLLINGKHSIAF